MGTRHLMCAKIGGEYKLANYGQWDGYPEGQGLDVLKFAWRLSDSTDTRRAFVKKLRAVREISKDEIQKIEADANRTGVPWSRTYPWLSRDAGSDIFDYVLKQPDGLALMNDLPFAADSLMCEWAYVLDFDAGTFEVYKGFNTSPLPEGARFSDLEPANTNEFNDRDGGPSYRYYQVKKVAGWPLNHLPREDEFLAFLNPKEDDEAA